MSRDRDTVTAVTAVQAGKGPARDSVLLGKYRVESTLGFGGMGLVVRAHNLALDEHVAIKLLRDDVQVDDDHVRRFLREAKAAVQLKSEHIAKIRDVGTLEDGRPFMVMELLEGMDLGKLLSDHGAIEPARAVDLVLQACDAIAEAHSLGIIHRDIKPTNLFLTRRRDDTELLKVLDFGISKAQAGPEMSLTQTSSVLGTPAYMSPEQMRSARTVDPRSDIWALGTVLYELVEGRAPFEASNFAELVVMVSTEPHAPMTRAPQLANVVTRALAKNVTARYQDIAELASDLEPFASDAARAQRQVRRIHRVLGKATARDSTPLPMSRDSTPLVSRDPTPRVATSTPLTTPSSALAPPPTHVPDEPRQGGGWKIVALLLGLFGSGIAAGLYVTRTGDADVPREQAASEGDAGTLAEPATVPLDASVANVPVDADAVQARVNDAGIDVAAAAEDAGSAAGRADVPPKAPKTVKRTPPRRTPPRRPPPPAEKTAPPAPAETGGTGDDTRTPPDTSPAVPPKKCDPFANPKGCS